jgi:hypothetical protein
MLDCFRYVSWRRQRLSKRKEPKLLSSSGWKEHFTDLLAMQLHRDMDKIRLNLWLSLFTLPRKILNAVNKAPLLSLQPPLQP